MVDRSRGKPRKKEKREGERVGKWRRIWRRKYSHITINTFETNQNKPPITNTSNEN